MHSPETLEALNKAYQANDNTIERKLALERKPTASTTGTTRRCPASKTEFSAGREGPGGGAGLPG